MESLNDTIWTDEETYEENPNSRAMDVACSISIPSCDEYGNSPGGGGPYGTVPAYYGPGFWNSRCTC